LSKLQLPAGSFLGPESSRQPGRTVPEPTGTSGTPNPTLRLSSHLGGTLGWDPRPEQGLAGDEGALLATSPRGCGL